MTVPSLALPRKKEVSDAKIADLPMLDCTAEADVLVMHDDALWMAPFREALSAAAVPYQEWDLSKVEVKGIPLDGPLFKGTRRPAVIYSRVSAKSHLRSSRCLCENAATILTFLNLAGRRNGLSGVAPVLLNATPDVITVGHSKAALYAALQAEGLRVPATVVAFGESNARAEAYRLRASLTGNSEDSASKEGVSVMIKANRPSSGRGVYLITSSDSPVESLGAPAKAEGSTVDDVFVVQEFVPHASHYRLEFIGNRFFYALKVFEGPQIELQRVGGDLKTSRQTRRAEIVPVDNLPSMMREETIKAAEAFMTKRCIDVCSLKAVEVNRNGRSEVLALDLDLNTTYDLVAEKRAGLPFAKSGFGALAQHLKVALSARTKRCQSTASVTTTASSDEQGTDCKSYRSVTSLFPLDVALRWGLQWVAKCSPRDGDHTSPRNALRKAEGAGSGVARLLPPQTGGLTSLFKTINFPLTPGVPLFASPRPVSSTGKSTLPISSTSTNDDGRLLPLSLIPPQVAALSDTFHASVVPRPDMPLAEIVHVISNTRLTPLDYSRNIFHIEIDVSKSKIVKGYKMGDALAVYPRNSRQSVDSFLKIFFASPFATTTPKTLQAAKKQLVRLPPSLLSDDAASPSTTTEDGGMADLFANGSGASTNSSNSLLGLSTLERLLVSLLDINGCPGKAFFLEICHFAKDVEDKVAIAELSLERCSKMYEAVTNEAWTYATFLERFPSVRPSFSDLARLIPPIKPRLYSIASSSLHCAGQLDLLVVEETWTTSKGVLRSGLCSSYLATVKKNEELVVSLTLSTMFLPPRHTQPVVMAGLGTGMAPFRAFLQERAYWKRKGVEIGPMSLYFGSRHQASEFLYGNELEAYVAEGVLTRLSCAFSRDQPQKIYIQDRMRENSAEIAKRLLSEDAHFYLCGPKWPVEDIKEVLLEGFMEAKNILRESAESTLHDLKERERYILEVY